MKEKNYKTPEVEVEQINDSDIVATSTAFDGYGPGMPLGSVDSAKGSYTGLLND